MLRPVRLVICWTGSQAPDPVAAAAIGQLISDALGVPVAVPTARVWQPGGKGRAGAPTGFVSSVRNPGSGVELPVLQPDGEWLRPNGEWLVLAPGGGGVPVWRGLAVPVLATVLNPFAGTRDDGPADEAWVSWTGAEWAPHAEGPWRHWAGGETRRGFMRKVRRFIGTSSTSRAGLGPGDLRNVRRFFSRRSTSRAGPGPGDPGATSGATSGATPGGSENATGKRALVGGQSVPAVRSHAELVRARRVEASAGPVVLGAPEHLGASEMGHDWKEPERGAVVLLGVAGGDGVDRVYFENLEVLPNSFSIVASADDADRLWLEDPAAQDPRGRQVAPLWLVETLERDYAELVAGRPSVWVYVLPAPWLDLPDRSLRREPSAATRPRGLREWADEVKGHVDARWGGASDDRPAPAVMLSRVTVSGRNWYQASAPAQEPGPAAAPAGAAEEQDLDADLYGDEDLYDLCVLTQAPTAEMAVAPPSIRKSAPTTYAESSDAR